VNSITLVPEDWVNINGLIEQIKSRNDAHRAGMILCHNGIVRATSRDGSPVARVTVRADHDAIRTIVEEQKKRPGIVDILVEVNEGELAVGDDLLAIVVAGDIREHVIPVMTDTLNLIKATATHKTEYPIP